MLAPVPLAMLADNGDGAPRPQEASRARRPAWKLTMLVLPVIPFPDIDPILVHIGPLAVRWYALAYIVGIIAGWFYARAIIASPRLWGGAAPFTVVDFDDFIIWVTLGIILGGRIGYVLFYNFPHFAAHPAEIVALWKGGMSFHGGFIGCVLAVVLFAWRRGIPFLSLGDVTTAVAPIGLFLGRLANFINGELWGRPTDVPWAMIFPNGGPLARHPSQLYEAALEGLVLLVVLGGAGALRRAQAARPRHRRLRARLWRRAHLLRAVPRARRSARLSLGRADHGHAALHSADPRRLRRHRLRLDPRTDWKKWLTNARRSRARSAD